MSCATIRSIFSWTCKSCCGKLFYPKVGRSRKSNSFSTWTIPTKKDQLLRDNKVWTGHLRFMSSSSTSTELDVKSYFNDQDIDKILKTVNDVPNLDDLQKFGFSKKAIKVLGARKNKLENENGTGEQIVKNIDDLVTIMGVTSSLRAFGNILERPNLSLKNPMFPVPTEEVVQKADSILSIVLHGSQISWCCIERNADGKTFFLKQLQFYPLGVKSKRHFISSLNEMMDLCKKLPESKLCIIEEYTSSAAANPSMFSYMLHLTQLRLFLLGRLSVRLGVENIIAIKTVAVARIFNTVVGTERVSGQHLVDNMITWKPLPSLSVPQRLKDEYENHAVVIKEGLSNAILLNLAYWRLTKQFTDSYM